MMKNKKGQGALEFLTTYGWAFLVILIMIGALGYFGILNPTRFLPERCNVNTEFSCDEFSLQKTGANDVTVNVVLENALGEAIDLDVNSLTLTSDVFGGSLNGSGGNCQFTPSGSTDVSAGGPGTPDYAATVSASQSVTITCPVTGTAITLPNEGSKLKVGFDMSYRPQGKTLAKPISGEIFAALQ
jgi:hypothetical protein